MKRQDYKSYDDLPLILSVKELSTVLGISRTSAQAKPNHPSTILRGRFAPVPR